MAVERKKLGFEKFVGSYFSDIGKYTLVNLIFAVPLCLCFALCFLVCRLWLVQAMMVILPLTVFLAAPFYSGVVVLSHKIYNDELVLGIFSEYIAAVKDNFKAFILHGLVAYLVFEGCYFGIVIYKYLASVSPVFYVAFAVSIVIALFFVFLLYGVSMMSAFFDLSLKDVYKNSALMTLGEIKNNFIATVCNLAFLAIVTLPVMFFLMLTNVWGAYVTAIVVPVYLALIMVLVVPTGVAAITDACLYKDMKRVITGEAKQNIENIRKEDEAQKLKKEALKKAPFSDVDIENIKNSNDEYIFYKGKMIKREVLLEEIAESEEV